VPYDFVVASARFVKHCFGSVALPQPNIASERPRLTALHPCVAICVAWVWTSDVIDATHDVGPVSGAM
jgi:hypothetical protein